MNYPSFQISLFESRRFNGDYKRMMNQITTRDFKYVNNAAEFADLSKLPACREYITFGSNMQDNLFIQEEMGLGEATGHLVTIIDFSDILAELLAINCNEDASKIRGIAEYSYISHCLTSMYTDDDTLLRFESIFKDEFPNLMQYLCKFCNSAELPTDIIKNFLSDVHTLLGNVMGYTAKAAQSYIKHNYGVSLILRSRSFNKLIFSTVEPANFDIELQHPSGVVMQVPVRTFKRGEYDVDYKERLKC